VNTSSRFGAQTEPRATTFDSRGLPVARLAIGAIVAALPALMTCALLAALFDATLLNYFPKVSDEIAYYQQTATFVTAGFNGGYFTNDEMPAPFAASHFGVHGPAFPVLYGMAGRVLGWSIQSGPIFNLGVLALAMVVFIAMTQPSVRQMLVLGVVILTSWWVTLMASITMQESLNQAFMVMAAACAARVLDPHATSRGRLLAVMLATLAIASVLRPTNWIVAVPLVLVAVPRRPIASAVGALAVALGVPVFWVMWRFLSAPIPDLPIDASGLTTAGAISTIASYFFTQLSMNAGDVFDLAAFVERPFFQYAVYESVAVAAVSGVLLLAAVGRARSAWRRGAAAEWWQRTSVRVDVVNAGVLGLALVALFGFYFDSEASISRVIAPFLLFSQLVMLATGCRPWLLGATIVASLFVAPSFITTYRDWRGDLFAYDRVRVETFRAQVAPLVVFRANDNAWCNTLLTMSYEREIATVPPGIGLSVARNDTAKTPVKSKYLLLTGDGPDLYRSRANLQHLGTIVLGELFLNRDAACD
jgi:hypothetical protein